MHLFDADLTNKTDRKKRKKSSSYSKQCRTNSKLHTSVSQVQPRAKRTFCILVPLVIFTSLKSIRNIFSSTSIIKIPACFASWWNFFIYCHLVVFTVSHNDTHGWSDCKRLLYPLTHQMIMMLDDAIDGSNNYYQPKYVV